MTLYGYTCGTPIESAKQATTIETFCQQRAWHLDSIHSETENLSHRQLSIRPIARNLLSLIEPGDMVLITHTNVVYTSLEGTKLALDVAKDIELKIFCISLNREIMSHPVFIEIIETLYNSEISNRQIIAGELYRGGNPPFGFRVENGFLVEDPEQQNAIEIVKTLRAEGKSLRSISAALGRINIQLSHKSVERILKRTQSLDEG